MLSREGEEKDEVVQRRNCMLLDGTVFDLLCIRLFNSRTGVGGLCGWREGGQ